MNPQGLGRAHDGAGKLGKPAKRVVGAGCPAGDGHGMHRQRSLKASLDSVGHRSPPSPALRAPGTALKAPNAPCAGRSMGSVCV